MNNKELDDKIQSLMNNIICAAVNYQYVKEHGDSPVRKKSVEEHRKLFTKQFKASHEELKELLNIKTQNNKKTDIFLN